MTQATEDRKAIRETLDNLDEDRLAIGVTDDNKVILIFDGNQVILAPEDAKRAAEVMLRAAEDATKKTQN